VATDGVSYSVVEKNTHEISGLGAARTSKRQGSQPQFNFSSVVDASSWVPEVSNHQRILDALRMGDPHLAEQTVVHITGLFLKAALAVWASG